MFIEKLTIEQLRELRKILKIKDSVYKNISGDVCVFNSDYERLQRLEDGEMLQGSNAMVERYVVFMEQIFGKEFIEYVLEYYGIPEDLIEKHYGYSDDDWDETK